VLVALCPEQTRQFDDALNSATSAIEMGARTSGMELGRAAAAAVLAARAESGYALVDPVFDPPEPGTYVPTVRRFGVRYATQQPWILRRADEVRPDAPPALDSATWSRDFAEVKSLGAKKSTTRTPEQTDSANFWPMRRTTIVLDQLIGRPGRSLVDDARFLALAEMAHSDAYVAMMDAKYRYNFWRPITAIRYAASDNNAATEPNPAWEPLSDTPPHPEYPCGHCLSAAAIGAVIAAEFGSAVPPLVLQAEGSLLRRYDTPREYVDDVSLSRIYVGVHYRFSVDAGIAMGTEIGELAAQRHFLALSKPQH
jgi:hypothetical protein